MTRFLATSAAVFILLLLHNFANGQTSDDAKAPLHSNLAPSMSKLLQSALEPYVAARCDLEVGIALASGSHCPKEIREMLRTEYADKSKSAILPWMRLELQHKHRGVSLIAFDYIQGIQGQPIDKEAASTISVYARRPQDWSRLERVTDLLSMPSISIEDLDRSKEPVVIKERIYTDKSADANRVVITLLMHERDKRTVTAETRTFTWNGDTWQAE